MSIVMAAATIATTFLRVVMVDMTHGRHDGCGIRASLVQVQMAVTTTIQVTLPAMGESVSEGTVLEWHKQEGDHVDLDETLVEISTDKVDAEVPAPVSGTVVKIHFAEGDTVS